MRFRQLAVGQGRGSLLAEQIEALRGGVGVCVLRSDDVAVDIVSVDGGIGRRVRAVDLDYTHLLISRVVVVLHLVAGLVCRQDQVARTVVGAGLGSLVGIGSRRKPLARVVCELRGVAVAVGHRNLVAGVVVGIAGRAGVGRAIAHGSRDDVARRVVGGIGNVTECVGLGGHASCGVVGGCGGGCIRRAVGLGHRDLPAGKVVLKQRDVAALVGVGDDVIAEVVGPGGLRSIGIIGFD